MPEKRLEAKEARVFEFPTRVLARTFGTFEETK